MTVEKDLGGKIQKVRQSRQISLETLAEKTGLEVELLQKIEEQGLIPSLAVLIKIARALGMRLGTFLDDDEKLGPAISRNGSKNDVTFTPQGTRVNENLNFFSLAPNKAGRNMEPFVINIKPDTAGEVLSSHEGEEFLYVLDGQIEILYGKETHVLGEGDSIYYDSIVAHQIHAANNKPARILGVIYTPY
ncbi:MAG: XRE family transcriptional regulator [Bacteroidales bacterium]|jgi:transcriptional regulator with XRE-family HTH domain|nr:XRE family transcriptional regulator [Bacteroidales bacterium]